jgi:hypothetical protein
VSKALFQVESCFELILPSSLGPLFLMLSTRDPPRIYDVKVYGGIATSGILARPNSIKVTRLDTCAGRPEFSFGQVAKLIENIGYVGKIDDFTIKPLTQNSFLLVGFSRTTGTASEASCIHRDAKGIQLQHGKAVDTKAIAPCKGELLRSGDDDVLSDSDPDPSSSDDDGSSAEDERGVRAQESIARGCP